MLGAIKKNIPDARLAYLAYIDSILPPESIKADNGIFLEYAPFEKYTAKDVDAAYRIERELAAIPYLLEFFGRKDSKVLEYWYDNSMLSKWKKPPAPFVPDRDKMRSDIAEYVSIGFEEIATFACFLGEDYEALYGSVDIEPFTDCFLTE